MFVILSLKDTGMSLEDIKFAVSKDDFTMDKFIESEINRSVNEIIKLQRRIMHLTNYKKQLDANNINFPNLLPFYAKVNNVDFIPEEQIQWLKNQENNDNSLVKWIDFIEELEFCYKNNITIPDKKAVKCVEFWLESILKNNNITSEMNLIYEKYYKNNVEYSFGLTKELYEYLQDMVSLYKKQ